MMGQVPYLPPNVKGWPGGRAWIDTSRLVTRYTLAETIAEGKVPEEMDPRMQGDMDWRETDMTEEERKLKLQERKMMPPIAFGARFATCRAQRITRRILLRRA